MIDVLYFAWVRERIGLPRERLETTAPTVRALIAELAAGKLAALTYEPAALPDGTLAHERGGTGNYSITVTGKSAHAGRIPHDGR